MGDELLRGWKEIAAFLQTSERTAQRWEKLHGLPVERLPNDKGGVIVAHRQRMRVWQDSAAGHVAMRDSVSSLAAVAAASAPGIFRRRRVGGVLVVVLAALLGTLIGGLAMGLRLFRLNGLTAIPVSSTRAEGSSATQPRLRFRVLLGEARTAVELVIPDRSAAMISGDGGTGIWLRPTLRDGGVDLEVSKDDRLDTRPPRAFATLRLERKGRARLGSPPVLEVEWLSTDEAH
jgi:hypothetical protein